MGQFLSSYLINNNMIIYDPIYCNHHESKYKFPATYRCQFSAPKNLIYMPTTPDNVIEEFREKMGDTMTDLLLVLKPFFISSSYGNDYIIQWVGCDRCLPQELKKYFTNHPCGWKENIKVWQKYEEIKV